MKKVAILLPNPLANDYRVLKTVHSLSKEYIVHIYAFKGVSCTQNV